MLASGTVGLCHAAEPVFLGYYFSGASKTMPPETIAFDYYTHICHAFLLGDEGGGVITSDDVPSRALTSAAHAKGVRVILSLGGWGSDGYFAAMAENPGAPARHVRKVLKIVEDYGYDGIDLDWEYPDTAEEAEGFAALTRMFREGLDKLERKHDQTYELTMAVTSTDQAARWLDKDLLLENMDFLNVMTYDFCGPWSDYAAHHSALFQSPEDTREHPLSVQSGMEYWVNRRAFPKDRLAVGISLYGRGFESSGPYQTVSKKGTNRYTALGYAEIRPLAENGWKRVWDTDASVPFLYAPDGSAFIGYDDTQSVAAKTRWAKTNGYRGIFFWAISHDRMNDGSYPLQTAAAKAWPRKTRKP